MTVEDGEDVLAPIDDEATLDALFPTAYSVMAENDWTLHRTAVRYYVLYALRPCRPGGAHCPGRGGDGILVVPDEAELAAVTPVIEDALEAQAELL
ncbi:hypothetical protein I4F81_012930 [Pyropia yezoensis]|uniref:Uncharacterized protein n=1 Tax=Pyropia yezoensis TaxID=2788 RepID=A0ABQ9T873_PYRYE|nr:hypothetical protein I4F81_012930 [Neopyropia yezoensis]